jgi:hypothetical protein
MAVPSIARVMPQVLREYLAARDVYEGARGALIMAYVQECRAWITAEALTEPQILARLSAVQVPEDLHHEILVLATL